MKKKHFCILLSCISFVTGFGQQLKVSYSSSVSDKPFTGTVVAYLSKENKEPKDASVYLSRFPCFSVSVKDIKPGQEIVIDDKAASYPTSLSEIERGEYYAQIVWDRNLGGRSIATSPGNMYNTSVKVNITKDTKQVYHITASQVIPAIKEFKETRFVKELKALSPILSKFKNKTQTVDGAVILPKEYYTEPNRRFPVLFIIFGYGGDYRGISGDTTPSLPVDSIPFMKVYLDGNCSWGHSVYANSENNGAWGDALTTEFIPLLEKTYRCNGARLLTGHSSGGWSVLWLQTHYPKVFHGCWSSSPDPVDFTNFQNVNLYVDKNMFYNKDSSLRMVATVAGFIPWATMKDTYQMENSIYRGEQMHSFNSVFSRKGKDGVPESICNSKTGEIDTTVVSSWKKYDIALYIRNNWQEIKSSLDDKVRISVGNNDNFLLNYSVLKLEAQMKDLHSTFQFIYYPGDHFTVSTPAYRKDGYQFLKKKYLQWLANAL